MRNLHGVQDIVSSNRPTMACWLGKRVAQRKSLLRATFVRDWVNDRVKDSVCSLVRGFGTVEDEVVVDSLKRADAKGRVPAEHSRQQFCEVFDV